MQIRTFTFLEVLNLLLQLIKQGKETAELIIIPRPIFQGHLTASLYNMMALYQYDGPISHLNHVIHSIANRDAVLKVMVTLTMTATIRVIFWS